MSPPSASSDEDCTHMRILKGEAAQRALAGLRNLGGSKSQSLDDSVVSGQRKSLIEAGF